MSRGQNSSMNIRGTTARFYTNSMEVVKRCELFEEDFELLIHLIKR